MRLEFGDVTFDGERRTLSREGGDVHVSPKAFRLLELLLERRPAAVSRAEIRDALWPGVFVSDGSIAILVNELRKAFGDQPPGPGWLRTVFGFGYAFEGTVRELSNSPARRAAHSVVWAGEVIPLQEGENLLGREPSVGIVVGHPSVSRVHARIEVAGNEAWLVDLSSKNGTWRGAERISGRVLLADCDELTLGSASVTYRAPGGGSSEETETSPPPSSTGPAP